jgi:hypothetical protein
MLEKVNKFLDTASDFLAYRKGLLPLVAILFIILNGILQFISGASWLADTNLFLHIGIVLAILGFMLAWAL